MNVETCVLKNRNGVEAEILNFGAILKRLVVPDRAGHAKDIVLGFDRAEEYVEHNPSYYGAIVGRFANRIGGGGFEIDGKRYTLAFNDGRNSLHGGTKGFDKVFWTMAEVEPGRAVELSYVSADLEEGYPGRLTIKVTYTLTDANELAISYEATTDQSTHVNLTHHSYFNLSGDFSKTVHDHHLRIDADVYTAADAEWIPTGEFAEVSGPLDFRNPTLIGRKIAQLKDGYNHCYVLKKQSGARVWHEASGRVMDVVTTEPGLQFYSAYYLDQSSRGKGGVVYPRTAALCLEAQHFADSPNKPGFPSTRLDPGQVYRQTTTYRFSAD